MASKVYASARGRGGGMDKPSVLDVLKEAAQLAAQLEDRLCDLKRWYPSAPGMYALDEWVRAEQANVGWWLQEQVKERQGEGRGDG